MKCPRCVQLIHREASSCPHCGFTIEHADELFGEEDVVLQKLTDAAGVLRMREREPAKKILERFEKRFPQFFTAVYIGASDELQNLRQFGLWLLNRAAFQDVELDRPNENGILIVLDVKAKNVAISYGYSLAPYLNEENTFDALSAGHPSLLQGDYLEALGLIIKRLERLLIKAWRRVERDPEAALAQEGVAPKFRTRSLRRIREGNRLTNGFSRAEQRKGASQ